MKCLVNLSTVHFEGEKIVSSSFLKTYDFSLSILSELLISISRTLRSSYMKRLVTDAIIHTKAIISKAYLGS